MKKKIRGNDVENYVTYCPYILAFVQYRDEANRSRTRVYYFGGKFEDYEHRMEKVLNDLAVTFRTSVKVLRRRIAILPDAGRRNERRKVPIVLIKGFCLVPLKFADLQEETKTVMGYVAYHYIERVQALDGNRCAIYFLDGMEPQVVNQSKKSVQEQMQLAQKLTKAAETEDSYWKYEFSIARNYVNLYRGGQKKTGRRQLEIH